MVFGIGVGSFPAWFYLVEEETGIEILFRVGPVEILILTHCE